MDIRSLIDSMVGDDAFRRIAMNPLAQFGRGRRRYLGATLLPESLRDENMYEETSIRYRTIVANDGTRYGPVQRKKGSLVGAFDVKLAEQDIGTDLSAQEYETIRDLARRSGRDLSMDAVARVTGFADSQVNLGLIEKIERMRWQAVVNATVQLRGDNEYTEDVAYSNPAGHRAAAGGAWSNDAYDPFADIYAMAGLLASKGFGVSRIICGTDVLTLMRNNAIVAQRTNRITVNSSGQIGGINGLVTREAINAALGEDGLPPITTYDLMYQTMTGQGYFFPRATMVLVATTGRDEEIDLGDNEPIPLPDTLGYVGVGVAAGQDDPGRVILAMPHADKPPRIDFQGWQTSLPVIMEPEAIAVIHTIA